MEERDVEIIKREAKRQGAGISIDIASPIKGQDAIFRSYNFGTEYFKIRTEK